MGFLSKLFGKSSWEQEQSGDKYYQVKAWGDARLEYEAALNKLEKDTPSYAVQKKSLDKKITNSTERLAEDHVETCGALIESQCFEEATDLIQLAAHLTKNSELQGRIDLLKKKLKEKAAEADSEIEEEEYFYGLGEDMEEEPDFQENDMDQFEILLGALPEEIQEAYSSYGEAFRNGYLALNHADFTTAVQFLSQALDDNPSPQSYIPFELASAYLNTGAGDKAQKLLEEFIPYHSESLPAYRLLCEVYWENGDFTKVENLITTLPKDIAESIAAFLLKGENFMRSGNLGQAVTFFEEVLEKYGWNQYIARQLALACEGLGDKSSALKIYEQLIGECSSCGSHIDPFIKKKFADLSFASGDLSTRILEMYLSLAQEDPENAIDCYRKVSAIYDKQGHATEAKRFMNIVENIQTGPGQQI